MRASKIFRRAGRLLKSRGWCQGATAVDGKGELVEPWDKTAVAFCAVGACQRVSRQFGDNYYETLQQVTGFNLVGADWNDKPGQTAEHVIGALDAAYILALQEEGLEPEDVLK